MNNPLASAPRYLSYTEIPQAKYYLLALQSGYQTASTPLLQGLPAETQLWQPAVGNPDFSALNTLLQACHPGTHLCICGDETFIWNCRNQAQTAGLLDAEMSLIKAAEGRQAYCVHCSQLQPISHDDEVTCQHCGVHLTIREHFSKRLGAYMGVCLNADQPYGEQ